MLIKKHKTSAPKVQGLRGQTCMPARKFRFPAATPMKTTKK